jgi:N6-L-threonylcarbamoyladenine synthase
MTTKFLAIETTCDETAAAVCTDEPRVLSSVVATQYELHGRFGGVVPEIAARAHVRQILPVIDAALREANTKLEELAAIAVTNRPGLVGSLSIGLTAAKTLSMALGIPLVGVDHLAAHIYACHPGLWQGRPAGLQWPQPRPADEIFPCVALVVSGGHTSLYYCPDPITYELLGAAIDDAAGEAFDKVAQLLGLGFPGGPAIQLAAEGGNPQRYPFPRSFPGDADSLDFSFSGLKTAVLYTVCPPAARSGGPGGRPGAPVDLKRCEPLRGQELADLAASFQEAVVDTLVRRCVQAVERTGVGRLCVGGGVAANKRLRERLLEIAQELQVELVIPPLWLCTDNAAMAALAGEYLRRGLVDDLSLELSSVPQRGRKRPRSQAPSARVS